MSELDETFLQSLLIAGGTSGNEREPVERFRQYVGNKAEEIHTDQMGNSLLTTNIAGRYSVMLSAHIDEIGLQVTAICDNGLLRVRRIGGLNTLNIIGQRVELRSESGALTCGVVVCKQQGNNNVIPDISDCYIDIDATCREDASRRVAVGDFATFDRNVNIGFNDILTSKSIDDRIGVYIMSQVFLQLAGKLKNVRLWVAATTQEEIGLRGMAVLAQNVQPDVCINIDVTDAVELDKKDLPEVGKGCVVYRNADSNPALRRMVEQTGRENGIPIQTAVGRNVTGGTDASRIQLFAPKTAVMDIAIPCKYMHTHNEKCSLRDVKGCIGLLAAFIKRLDNGNDELPTFTL